MTALSTIADISLTQPVIRYCQSCRTLHLSAQWRLLRSVSGQQLLYQCLP